jgi:hypothetical protein
MLAWLGLVLLLVASVPAAASDEPRPVIEGSWIATFGQRQFRGEWSAQALANNTNAAVGSWTVFDDGEQIVMRGTWSAEKAANRWEGSWSARVENGPVLSGTWGADPKSMAGKTFEGPAAADRREADRRLVARPGGSAGELVVARLGLDDPAGEVTAAGHGRDEQEAFPDPG